MAIPKEYTPEITEAFRERLARGIRKRGAAGVGAARAEALSRGLSGDPSESAAVGAARGRTREGLSNLDSEMAYRLAGLGREERLTGEGREYKTSERLGSQEFTAAESEKDRGFRQRMARMKQDIWRERESLGTRRDYQSDLWNIGAGVGGSAAKKAFPFLGG